MTDPCIVARGILTHSTCRRVSRSLCDAGGGKNFLNHSSKTPQSSSIKWSLCWPWEMINFNFMFIKPFLLCIFIYNHLNTWSSRIVRQSLAVTLPSCTNSGSRECHYISAQAITDPPLRFTLGIELTG